MRVPLVFRSPVEKDLADAAGWYDRERQGLGAEFLGEAYRAFGAIEQQANSFPKVWKDVRRALMKRFPYAIYFQVADEAIVILVVLHTARRPSSWKKRSN